MGVKTALEYVQIQKKLWKGGSSVDHAQWEMFAILLAEPDEDEPESKPTRDPEDLVRALEDIQSMISGDNFKYSDILDGDKFSTLLTAHEIACKALARWKDAGE